MRASISASKTFWTFYHVTRKMFTPPLLYGATHAFRQLAHTTRKLLHGKYRLDASVGKIRLQATSSAGVSPAAIDHYSLLLYRLVFFAHPVAYDVPCLVAQVPLLHPVRYGSPFSVRR